MNTLALLVMAAAVGCAVGIARYQAWYDTRDVLDEDEAKLPPSNETPWCRISREYSSKTCNYGTHLNKECGYRQDCLQGPGEPCTEKMEEDNFGLRCAAGYLCHKKYARCVGIRFDVDSNALLSGPGEPCTEKMEEDNFGLRCAAGYLCHKKYARCVGIRFDVDSNALLSVMWGPEHAGHALQTRSLRPLTNL